MLGVGAVASCFLWHKVSLLRGHHAAFSWALGRVAPLTSVELSLDASGKLHATAS